MYETLGTVNSYNYSTLKLFAWWLHVQSGLSYRCNPAFVGLNNNKYKFNYLFSSVTNRIPLKYKMTVDSKL